MSVFQRFSLKKHNFGHFVVIAIILLVGFSVAVYFLKHPALKISKDSPIAVTEKTSTDGEQNSNKNQTSEDTSVKTDNSSNLITQTGMPVTGQSDKLYLVFLISILSFIISKYIMSRACLRRYF